MELLVKVLPYKKGVDISLFVYIQNSTFNKINIRELTVKNLNTGKILFIITDFMIKENMWHYVQLDSKLYNFEDTLILSYKGIINNKEETIIEETYDLKMMDRIHKYIMRIDFK